MSFVSDLKEGEEYEKQVKDKLLSEFGVEFKKNENKTKVDLVHPLFSAEIKYDRMMDKTQNIFIEIGYKWADSWLFKDEDVDLYIHGNKSFAFIFKSSKLRKDILEGVEDGKFRTIKWGDGYNSTGVLIPVCSAEDLCHAKLEF